METNDLTVRILQEIRDELRDTKATLGARIDGNGARIEGLGASLNARIDATNIEVRTTREELRAEIRTTNQRLTEYSLRHTTRIHDLVGMMRYISSKLDLAGSLEERMDACERDIADLKRRLGYG